MKENPLVKLGELGQSIWLDYISRGLITSGDLQRLINQDGLKGMTSNPTIFEKAIDGSKDYQEEMKTLVSQGKSVEEIYDLIILSDIAHAAELLSPVYDATGGTDGFVSIEVPPQLALDTQGSVKEAHRLFDLLNRPNIMVKIPGTSQGLPAIEQLISEGVNVNITLLFDIDNHRQVMEAYLSGLEKRLKSGKPISTIASVASFFVSRVDTAVDKALFEKIETTQSPQEKEKLKKLLGGTAVANAKLAYQNFKEVFSSPRFLALKDKGAKVQRPLWASTSTKNPNYSDILYVQELIGAQTVNTIPPETLEAYREHGTPELSIENDLEGAKAHLRKLADAGINLKKVTRKLQEDGVKLFSDSFQKLIQSISQKREALHSGTIR